MKLPFLTINDIIFNVLQAWPQKWHALDIAELEKSVAHKKKDGATLSIT